MRDYGNTNAVWIGPTPPPGVSETGRLWWRNDPDGVMFVYYDDGNTKQWVPATPTPASQWSASGSTVTPADPATAVVIPGPTTGDLSALRLGTRTAKSRITSDPANNNSRWTINDRLVEAGGTAWSQDDPAKPSWAVSMFADTGLDAFDVARSAPGGAYPSTLMQLTNAGDLNLYSPDLSGRAVTCYPSANSASGGANSATPFAVVTWPTYTLRAGRIYRLTAHGLFQVNNGHNMYIILSAGALPGGSTIVQLLYTAGGSIVAGIWQMNIQIVPWGTQLLVHGTTFLSSARMAGANAALVPAVGIFGGQPTVAGLPNIAFSFGCHFPVASANNVLDYRGATLEVL